MLKTTKQLINLVEESYKKGFEDALYLAQHFSAATPVDIKVINSFLKKGIIKTRKQFFNK